MHLTSSCVIAVKWEVSTAQEAGNRSLRLGDSPQHPGDMSRSVTTLKPCSAAETVKGVMVRQSPQHKLYLCRILSRYLSLESRQKCLMAGQVTVVLYSRSVTVLSYYAIEILTSSRWLRRQNFTLISGLFVSVTVRSPGRPTEAYLRNS